MTDADAAPAPAPGQPPVSSSPHVPTGTALADPPAPKSSHHLATVFGLGLGILLGLILNWIATDPTTGTLSGPAMATVGVAQVIGNLFLRLMFMVVLPLVFSALALAVVEIGDLRSLGRMGLWTLCFTGILSASAVLIGVSLVNVLQPGRTLSEAQHTLLTERFAKDAQHRVEKADEAKPLSKVLVDMFPENPLQEMVGAVDGSSKGNGMLAVMVFSLVCGIAITSRPQECAGFVSWLQGLHAISMAVIEFTITLAPIGAGCLVFSLAAQLGFDMIKTLIWFVMTTILGLGLQLVVVYSIVIYVFARMSPLRFFNAILDAILVAFGTSSSSATLPTALRVAETRLGVPSRISSFVLTVGATGNQNGTALFEGVVILFLAQVMGVELTGIQQFQVVLMAILAGVGTAGVPGGSLPLIVVVMKSVGIPGESIGIILGVDRLLDMCRTVINVVGDLVVTACVARTEARSESGMANSR